MPWSALAVAGANAPRSRLSDPYLAFGYDGSPAWAEGLLNLEWLSGFSPSGSYLPTIQCLCFGVLFSGTRAIRFTSLAFTFESTPGGGPDFIADTGENGVFVVRGMPYGLYVVRYTAVLAEEMSRSLQFEQPYVNVSPVTLKNKEPRLGCVLGMKVVPKHNKRTSR